LKERKYLKMIERKTREESEGMVRTRLARISPVGQPAVERDPFDRK
jgi:hypothetical protein